MNHDPAPAFSSLSPVEQLQRAELLVAELRARAAGTTDPRERIELRRSADSLVRFAAALRP